jgi:hypothetical protein
MEREQLTGPYEDGMDEHDQLLAAAREINRLNEVIAELDKSVDDHIALYVETLTEAQRYHERLKIAIEFLRAYREQGAPGRVGRAMLDEFLAEEI